VPDNNVSDYQFAPLAIGDAKEFALVVENPYPATAEISFPDQGKTYFIPWFSSRTIPLDVTNQPVKFVIKHGYYQNAVAYGSIGASASASASAGASASLASFLESSKSTLDDLIARNSVVAYAGGELGQQDDADLRYYTPVYKPAKTYVRGYW
jgi:hypothetical protein